jgi:hypothetical protein
MGRTDDDERLAAQASDDQARRERRQGAGRTETLKATARCATDPPEARPRLLRRSYCPHAARLTRGGRPVPPLRGSRALKYFDRQMTEKSHKRQNSYEREGQTDQRPSTIQRCKHDTSPRFAAPLGNAFSGVEKGGRTEYLSRFDAPPFSVFPLAAPRLFEPQP